MGVEAAMGEARILHQVSHADAMRAPLAQPHRGLLNDPRVGFQLVFPGVTNQRSHHLIVIVCIAKSRVRRLDNLSFGENHSRFYDSAPQIAELREKSLPCLVPACRKTRNPWWYHAAMGYFMINDDCNITGDRRATRWRDGGLLLPL